MSHKSILILFFVFSCLITSCNRRQKALNDAYNTVLEIKQQLGIEELKQELQQQSGLKFATEDDTVTVSFRDIVKENPDLIDKMINCNPSRDERIKAQRDAFLKSSASE